MEIQANFTGRQQIQTEIKDLIPKLRGRLIQIQMSQNLLSYGIRVYYTPDGNYSDYDWRTLYAEFNNEIKIS